MKKTTKEIFNEQFTVEGLNAIFRERVSQSGAVGKDGVHPLSFEKILEQEIDLIRRNVFSEKYHFTRYKQRLILKGPGKAPREISIASVRDRICLRGLNNCLLHIFPEAKSALAHQYIGEIKKRLIPLAPV